MKSLKFPIKAELRSLSIKTISDKLMNYEVVITTDVVPLASNGIVNIVLTNSSNHWKHDRLDES